MKRIVFLLVVLFAAGSVEAARNKDIAKTCEEVKRAASLQRTEAFFKGIYSSEPVTRIPSDLSTHPRMQVYSWTGHISAKFAADVTLEERESFIRDCGLELYSSYREPN